MPAIAFIGLVILGGLAAAALARRPSSTVSVTSNNNQLVGQGADAAGASIAAAAPAMFSPVVEFVEEIGAAVTGYARKLFALPARAEPYADAITRAEQANGIPQSLLARLLYQESRFRPEVIDGTKRSSAGAVGIAQFMPATAAGLGVDPLNADQAIAGAGRYLRQLYDSLGDWPRALAAYNWGIGNVQRKGIDQAPAETRAYVSDILGDVEV